MHSTTHIPHGARPIDTSRLGTSEFILNTLSSPKALQAVTKQTLDAMNNVAQQLDENASVDDVNMDTNKPEIPLPTQEAAEKVAKGDRTLIGLMLMLWESLSDFSLIDLRARLDNYLKFKEAQQNTLENIADSLNQSSEILEKAHVLFENAAAEFDEIKREVERLQAELKDAEIILKQVQTNTSPNNPFAQEEVEKAEQRLADAQKALTAKQERLKVVEEKLRVAFSNAELALDNFDQLNADLSDPENPDPKNPDQAIPVNLTRYVERPLTSAALLTKLMLELQRLIGENTQEGLQKRMAIYQAQQAATQKSHEKEAANYAKWGWIAKILNSLGGWLGKAIGVGMMLWGLASVILTGGGGLGLFMVGLSLFIVDSSLAAAGETTITEAVMKFLLKDIILPMVADIGNLFDGMLKAFGLEGEELQTAKDVIGGIATAYVIIAMIIGAVLIKNSKAAQQMGTQALNGMKTAVSGIPPQAAKTMLSNGATKLSTMKKELADLIGEALMNKGMSVENIPVYLSKLNTGMHYTGAVGTVTESAIGVSSATYQNLSLKSMSSITVDRGILTNLKKYMRTVMDAFTSASKLQGQIIKDASNVMIEDQKAGSAIIRNTKA